MKIYRLFGILTMLLNKKTLTAKELADKFEVSTRTIYRDIDALSEAGIPIYANKGYQGGISLMEHYTLNKTLLTKEESEGIFLTLQTLQATDYPEVNLIMDKFSSLFNDLDMTDWVDVDFSQWGTSARARQYFDMIKKAILMETCIKIKYAGSNGILSDRTIAPLKLIFKSQSWYLWGYCYLRKDYRLFKTQRIHLMSLDDKRFDRSEFDLSISTKDMLSMENYSEDIGLTLKFKSENAFMVYDSFGPNNYELDEDGNFIVKVTFPKSNWVMSYILSFGSAVEIIEPQEFKEEYLLHLKKILDKY